MLCLFSVARFDKTRRGTLRLGRFLDDLWASSSAEMGTPHNHSGQRLRNMSNVIFNNVQSLKYPLETLPFGIPFPKIIITMGLCVSNRKEAGERVPLHAAACEQGPIS